MKVDSMQGNNVICEDITHLGCEGKDPCFDL